MKTSKRPTRTTVAFGLAASLSFIPLTGILTPLLGGPIAFRSALWAYLALYGVLLARWGGRHMGVILFPILLGLFCVFGCASQHAFLLLSISLLGWIRSGICFPRPAVGVLLAEILLGFGGALLVAWFGPHTPLAQALGVWMFFLVQSLYFPIFAHRAGNNEKERGADPFETARGRAENILAG